jgi:hypothetical protein
LTSLGLAVINCPWATSFSTGASLR